jgi:hypothetical protein
MALGVILQDETTEGEQRFEILMGVNMNIILEYNAVQSGMYHFSKEKNTSVFRI